MGQADPQPGHASSIPDDELPRLLLGSVRDYAIVALDLDGHVLSWNVGAQRLTGYSAEEIIGKRFTVLYPAEDVARGVPDRELKTAAGPRGRVENDGWRVRKDDTLFWAEDITTALRDEKGALVGFAKVIRDLSERRAAQERSVAEARRAARIDTGANVKTDFLNTMSHELRTPLNAIGGYAELIEMGVGGPVTKQQRDYLERIRGSQQQLLAIINDLLSFSRIETGQITYDLGPVSLQAVVATVLELMAPHAARKGIHLARGHSTRAVARADRHKVEQILLNLLSNSVKFTPDGGRISTSTGESKSGVFISVTDSGPGVPANQRETIFEPFVQLGRSLSSAHHGIGLGLAISRDLARAMDGDIHVDSSPNHGAMFVLTLPKA
ncbi:MAG TPA: PAS domain-containing sensor histidine kinase [Gemmatimonadaceae bacterium]|nr:PAS domain-containing sensor histidine kinase [Gemmatimonadaceae bacterium]